MGGLRHGACGSKRAKGGGVSICTIGGAMMVNFVRPRPMVFVGLSVSMGPKGRITVLPIGPSNFLMSIAERSGLNFVRSTLRLSKGSTSRTLVIALEAAFFIRFVLAMIGISF